MQHFRRSVTTACLASTLLIMASLAVAADAPPRGEAVVASSTVTATVTGVDQATREFTLRSADGQEASFVAGDEVKNFAQMKVGDVVSATYSEAFAYEVKKGGDAAPVAVAAAAAGPAPGMKPAGAFARQVTATVSIVAIDREAPSVTFRGPEGNTRTIKVRYPDKLEGVSVGDTVEIKYVETVTITVAAQPGQ